MCETHEKVYVFHCLREESLAVLFEQFCLYGAAIQPATRNVYRDSYTLRANDLFSRYVFKGASLFVIIELYGLTDV